MRVTRFYDFYLFGLVNEPWPLAEAREIPQSETNRYEAYARDIKLAYS